MMILSCSSPVSRFRRSVEDGLGLILDRWYACIQAERPAARPSDVWKSRRARSRTAHNSSRQGSGKQAVRASVGDGAALINAIMSSIFASATPAPRGYAPSPSLGSQERPSVTTSRRCRINASAFPSAHQLGLPTCSATMLCQTPFHRRLRIEVVEDDLGDLTAFQLDDDPAYRFIGLVAQTVQAIAQSSFSARVAQCAR